MLKFACVVLLLVGSVIAEEFKWEDVPLSDNATQCIYRSESKKLACRSISGIVECPAVIEYKFGKVPTNFEVYGLRRDPIKSEVSPVESRIYELYPRPLDNSTYVNYTVTVNDKTVELYLYGSSEPTYTGLRVSDVKCYVRLIDTVFNRATARQVVEVKSGLHAELFGEILAVEKPAQKRWLGFGFPWLWGLGMWGWGFGWGFPFWG
jgi:hypothetical protein